MAGQLRLRSGTTSQHNTFTGAEGEVTYDTNKKTIVVHDGTTVGGEALLNTPNATETVAGKAKIATTAIAQAGTNDTDFITALKIFNVLDFDYINKTATRSLNTVYTNDNKIRRLNLTSNTMSNATISLRVEVTKNSITTLLVVDMNASTGGLALGGSVDIPPNAQYKVNFYSPDGTVITGFSIKTWLEG